MKSRHAIPVIVIAELFGASLWFSINAVADALHRAWGMTPVELGYLTSAVQLGFITGTLLFALSGLADRFSASRIFASCALLGALVNAGFVSGDGELVSGVIFRFATGLALAGIYPIGMKLVVSWEPGKAGNVLGWLVGMLVLGSGLPHFIRGLNVTPNWQAVIYTASALAAVAGLMVWWLGDGPHHGSSRTLQWGAALKVFTIPDFRAPALGYFGHMWELYAFYTITPLLIGHLGNGAADHHIYLAASGVFLAGGVGCIGGGMVSHRLGSSRVAMIALTGSALCCLVYPWVSVLTFGAALTLLFVWGCFVVTDSPQFSALASNACPPERVGGALALMNSIGFAITVVSIELATLLWDSGREYVSWLLLPGPVLGLLAMRRMWGK
ncbi:MAG: MFS transporter [Gammaproteobacteria bacterium]|jgi:MFS family permease